MYENIFRQSRKKEHTLSPNKEGNEITKDLQNESFSLTHNIEDLYV